MVYMYLLLALAQEGLTLHLMRVHLLPPLGLWEQVL